MLRSDFSASVDAILATASVAMLGVDGQYEESMRILSAIVRSCRPICCVSLISRLINRWLDEPRKPGPQFDIVDWLATVFTANLASEYDFSLKLPNIDSRFNFELREKSDRSIMFLDALVV